MSIQSIFALIVVTTFGTNHLIQGEIIRGVDIPRINITRIVGGWNLVASTKKEDRNTCGFIFVEQQSDNKFTMNATVQFKPQLKKNYPNSPQVIFQAIVDANMTNDSNIISTKNNHTYDGSSMRMIIFDVVYDSYMAMLVAVSDEEITHGNRGYICIFGREKELYADIVEKVKKSVFYPGNVEPQSELRSTDQTVCK